VELRTGRLTDRDRDRLPAKELMVTSTRWLPALTPVEAGVARKLVSDNHCEDSQALEPVLPNLAEDSPVRPKFDPKMLIIRAPVDCTFERLVKLTAAMSCVKVRVTVFTRNPPIVSTTREVRILPSCPRQRIAVSASQTVDSHVVPKILTENV